MPPSLSLSAEVRLRNCEFRPIVTCFDNIGRPVGRGPELGWRATPARVLPNTKTVPTVVATLSIEMALARVGKPAGPSPPQVRRLTMLVLVGILSFGSARTASSTSGSVLRLEVICTDWDT